MQIPAPTGHDARGLERKRRWLRLLFFIAGRIADHWRTRRLHLARAAPWARLLAEVISRLGAIATSSGQQPRQRLLSRPDTPDCRLAAEMKGIRADGGLAANSCEIKFPNTKSYRIRYPATLCNHGPIAEV
jgi:hypothetical protein